MQRSGRSECGRRWTAAAGPELKPRDRCGERSQLGPLRSMDGEDVQRSSDVKCVHILCLLLRLPPNCHPLFSIGRYQREHPENARGDCSGLRSFRSLWPHRRRPPLRCDSSVTARGGGGRRRLCDSSAIALRARVEQLSRSTQNRASSEQARKTSAPCQREIVRGRVRQLTR
jgi:hypothetical protein